MSILQDIINDFDTNKLLIFFREKNRNFKPVDESWPQYNDGNFSNGLDIGQITFSNSDKLIFVAFQINRELSETSGKKAQYEKAKKILKDTQSDAGIFVFYDENGNFRFSLVYTNYLGTGRNWSNFRRFTYFVSKEFTNKTFYQRIGNGDFSSLENIKEAFSVEKVTKEFYKNISYWYFWAVRHVQFPKDAENEENGRNIAVIRLITRIIFIWFMRVRKLVPDTLFDEQKIKEILKNLSPDDTTYYKAILQNLFFATLNTPIKKRRFRVQTNNPKGVNKDYGENDIFRYEDYFKKSEKMKELFSDIPFLNGGLFECLDRKREKIIIDGFSRTKSNQPIVPNFLFFSNERKVNLSDELGAKCKNCNVQGLINILYNYNFTIDENNPNDQEVALDPEMLGRVFENLLASFNPETSSTVRKTTGSYYTPREIVDYMVTQSIKEYFKTKLNADKDSNILEKLDNLFDIEKEGNPFNEKITKQIIKLIDDLKIVDPAVGSGAFPMGILNKLVFILSKLDPKNKYWKQTQLNAAKNIPDPKSRKCACESIERNFDEKNVNYGRKLYLIQKCIYGVDIQKIAVEIAKLRFFIALLVDEEIDKDKKNMGVEPLPNLEFKIMQGNSLISEFMGINFENGTNGDNDENGFNFKDEIDTLITEFQEKKSEYQNEPKKKKKDKLKKEIEDLMIQIFETKLKKQKKKYFKKIESIEEKYSVVPNEKERKNMILKEKEELYKTSGFNLENIENQLREYTHGNKTKPFFLWKLYFAEVFTGENPGFDIVIANPPYIREKGNAKVFEGLKKSKYYQGKMNFMGYFLHKAIDITKETGIISYITSRYWLNSSGANKLIQRVKNELSFLHFIDIGKLKVFDEVAGHHMIAVYQKQEKDQFIYKKLINNLSDINSNVDTENIQIKYLSNKKVFSNTSEIILEESFYNDVNINSLGEITDITQGLIQNPDKVSSKAANKFKLNNGEGVFILTQNEFNQISFSRNEMEYIKSFYDEKDYSKYMFDKNNNKKLIYITKNNCGDINNFPNIRNHLIRFKKIMDQRRETKKGSVKWFQLHWPRKEKYFKNKKIIFASMFKTCHATYVTNEMYFGMSTNIIISKNGNYKLKYILAILNSKFAENWFYKNGRNRGIGVDIGVKKLKQFPVKEVTIKVQEPFIELVDKIIEIAKDGEHLRNPQKKYEFLQLETEIDARVAHLYGLTEEEYGKILEGTDDTFRIKAMNFHRDLIKGIKK